MISTKSPDLQKICEVAQGTARRLLELLTVRLLLAKKSPEAMAEQDIQRVRSEKVDALSCDTSRRLAEYNNTSCG
jgi:hypothetical protein